jgi:hypothetical protein
VIKLTTKTENKQLQKLIDMTKAFASPKKSAREALKCALVNQNYITTTNAYILAQIKHNTLVEAPYLYHFYEKAEQDNASSYPNTDRLFPDVSNAKQTIAINVNEWLVAHKLALILASEDKQHKKVHLKEDTLLAETGYQQNFSQKLRLSSKLQEPIAYNCEFMLAILKLAKKLKLKELELHYFGSVRPMLFIGEDVKMLLLPIKVTN